MNIGTSIFVKFSTCSVIFCFAQWTLKYDLFEKYFNFRLKLLVKVLGYYLTNNTDLDHLNFLVSCHLFLVCVIFNNIKRFFSSLPINSGIIWVFLIA